MHASSTKRLRSVLLRQGIVCLLLLGCTTSCGPQKSKEQRYWEEYKESVAKHSARWPGFSTVLKGMLQRAEPAWNTAVAVTDKAEKTKKMKTINKAVIKLVRRLDEVLHKTETAKESIRTLKAMNLDKAGNAKRQTITVQARKTLESIDRTLADAKPMGELAALTALEPVISQLIALQAHLKRSSEALKSNMQ